MLCRLSTELHSCSTIRDLRYLSSNEHEETSLSDEDEYLCKLKYKYPSITLLPYMFCEHPPLVCDDCKKLYHGVCPVHGPLSELDQTTGYDQASLAYTQQPVPAQLTVRPSLIPGTGLGVFSTTFICKGVRLGPYVGDMVERDDMGDLHNTSSAEEVRNSVFLCMKCVNLCYL